MVTTLGSGAMRLTLEPDPTGWCRVRLIRGHESLDLGGDAANIVRERLRRALDDSLDAKRSSVVDGVEVCWVLSLAEGHASVYAGDHAGKRTLFIHDADARPIARIALGDEERRRWIVELDAEHRNS